eukprot:358007-Chlamydomonas_euryale.AAC.9
MAGLSTGGSRPPCQKSGFDGDPCHFDPICELAISIRSPAGSFLHRPAGACGRTPEVGLSPLERPLSP